MTQQKETPIAQFSCGADFKARGPKNKQDKIEYRQRMGTMDVTSSQSKPHELVEAENIWGQILHDERGEKVLRNLSRSDAGNKKLQTVNFREAYFEDERTLRHNNRVIFIQPKDDIATVRKTINDKLRTRESNKNHTHAAFTHDLSLPACEALYPGEESFQYRTHDVFVYGADTDSCMSRGAKDDSKSEAKKDPFDNKLNRKDADINLCKSSQIKFQPQTSTTEKQKILPNTRTCIPCSKPAAKQNQFPEPNSKALLQNWFTKRSTEPVKPDKQESYTVDQETLHHENFGKRIKNAFLQKAITVSLGFKAANDTPVLELDNIGRPSETRKMDDSWKQPSRQRVSKIFGVKAEKYAVFDEVELTKVEGMNIEKELVGDGAKVANKNVQTGRSKWSKFKFRKKVTFSSEKSVSPQVSQCDEVEESDVKINDNGCSIKTSNRNATITDYHKMVEQRGSE